MSVNVDLTGRPYAETNASFDGPITQPVVVAGSRSATGEVHQAAEARQSGIGKRSGQLTYGHRWPVPSWPRRSELGGSPRNRYRAGADEHPSWSGGPAQHTQGIAVGQVLEGRSAAG